MAAPILATKLYLPPPRSKAVLRPRLTTRLTESLHHKLTLISAPAGFGKTTLVSAWVATSEKPVAWLSLDRGDSDPARFLTYLVAALQRVVEKSGGRVLELLQFPQPPIDSVLTTLLNDLTATPKEFVLVLDDYHVIDNEQVDHVLGFLLEHLPPHIHFVIATREDPPLPLARLRAQSQLTELRAADLRFTPEEAAEFLNGVMGLQLAAVDIARLETRTEGWIAGLQLAALSLQNHRGTSQRDTDSFIRSFTGSHRFVLDYLLEEVLQRQSENVQAFLLKTSVLERLCGPLCDAVLGHLATSGQRMLERLERANLFLVPLDSERRWYRYHHLFAELLRQRLQQNAATTGDEVTEYHKRAGTWFEDNGLELEAFHHAVAAEDAERAARLAEGSGMPLLFRGAVVPVLSWLGSLPETVLNARPSLWVMYASALLFVNRTGDVDAKLRAAEAALQAAEPGEGETGEARNQLGHIAAIRATLAIPRQQVETILEESHRALALLHPDNLPVRTAITWTLGFAYQLQGNRAAASRAFTEAMSSSEAIGHIIINLAATTGLGYVQETETQLHLAARSYRRVLEVAGDPPWPLACEAYLGLARLHYEWNDLDAAEAYGQRSVHLTQQMQSLDTFAGCGELLARLHLVRGDGAGAVAALAEAERFLHERGFMHRLPMIAAAQVRALLYRGDLSAAAHLAETHDLSISKARVKLAQGDPSAALALLEPVHQRAVAKRWVDETLEATILQAVAHHANGRKGEALQRLRDALVLAEPGGYVRRFVDEGLPMFRLVSEVAALGVLPDYTSRLRAAFEAETQQRKDKAASLPAQPLTEPLSQRELEILRLVSKGLSNRDIGKRLFRALDTVKGHNRSIYGKLGVKNRTEAVARARELGLL